MATRFRSSTFNLETPSSGTFRLQVFSQEKIRFFGLLKQRALQKTQKHLNFQIGLNPKLKITTKWNPLPSDCQMRGCPTSDGTLAAHPTATALGHEKLFLN
jgi:hypothetical protein